MVLQALYPTKSAVSLVEKPAGGETPTVLLGCKSMDAKDSDDSKFGVECPTCGRDFSSEHGMKVHHSKSHGESIAGEVAECDTCGNETRKSTWTIENHEHLFCSDECRIEWKDKRVTVICAHCGTEKQVSPSLAKTERSFCNRECYGEWQSENKRGNASPAWEGGRAEVTCANCGDTTEIKQARVDLHENTFCDDLCKGEWYSKHHVGENNPNWQGGFNAGYGPNWPEQRQRALERDDRECQICGRGGRELGQEPDVHHIVPLERFDSSKQANRLRNLITLCREHHARWEGVPIMPQ